MTVLPQVLPRRPAPDGVHWRGYLRPHRRALTVGVVLTLAETALDLLAPWPLKVVADNVIGRQHLTGWLQPLDALRPALLALVAAAVMVGAASLSALLAYSSIRLVRTTGDRIGAQLRLDAFTRLIELDIGFHERHRSAELGSRLTGDVTRTQDALVAWADVVVPQVLTLVGMLAVVLWVDPFLGLLALVVCPPLAMMTALRRRLVQAAEARTRERAGHLANAATDLLRNIRAVQVFGRQDHARARYLFRSDAALTAALAATELEARFSPMADVVLSVGGALVLAVGAGRVVHGHLTLGTLLVLLAYVAGLYAPVRSLARLGSTFARGKASRDRLAEIFRGPPRGRLDSRPPASATRRPPSALRHAIEFRDVSFSYPGGPPVLDRLDLTIPAGQLVCLVGPSGAGKSTLLALLLRLYEPSGGAVLFDGTDVGQLDVDELREEFALVPQDAWLLDGSLADNMRFGRPGATDAQVEAVARQALLSPLVDRSPDGLLTQVGEGGLALSGGERRRLSLARALLRHSSVLLLDEPTSGLDAGTESALVPVLRAAALGRTVLMVTHRLALAELADLVVVMADGRVVERGTPVALHRPGTVYQHLHDLQHPAGHVRTPVGQPVLTR